jgi:hypothetical protein
MLKAFWRVAPSVRLRRGVVAPLQDARLSRILTSGRRMGGAPAQSREGQQRRLNEDAIGQDGRPLDDDGTRSLEQS